MAGSARGARASARGSRGAQRSYHHGALKDALLDSAEAVLLDVGLEGFTLRECARRAGVSHGAPAHHFGDARGLLSELTAVSFEDMAQLMARYRAETAPEPFAQFVATGLAYVDYALAHRARFQLMFRSDRVDFARPRLQAAADAAYAHLHATVESMAAASAPEAVAARIALAWSTVHGFSTLMLDNRFFAESAGGDARTARELMRTLLEMTRTVFEPGAAQGQAAGTKRRNR